MNRLVALAIVVLTVLSARTVSANDGLASAECRRFEKMYIAPMVGTMYYRMYVPDVGMVEFRHVDGQNKYVGADGWSAALKDEEMTVRPPAVKGHQVPAYVFRDGRPLALLMEGKRYSCQAADVQYSGSAPSPMWEDHETFEEGRWAGRLAWPYVNPNRTAVLYLSLALAGLCLCLFGSHLWLRICGGGFFSVCAALTIATRSRGGLMAFALGIGLMVAVRFFNEFIDKYKWSIAIGACIVLLMGAGALCFISRTPINKGDGLRVELLRTAPRMMADAPCGWGNFMRPGPAYVSWYQPPEGKDVTFTLVSGHLTHLVSFGWFGRFAWLFGWMALLLALFKSARKGESALPVALWAAFGLADVFNPVDFSWSLWILPVASLGLWLRKRPWRLWRQYLKPMSAAALVAVMGVLAFWLAGIYSSRRGDPALYVDGGRMLINGAKPSCWVVDDEKTLGWVIAGKEIRNFYSKVPNAKPLGYVRRLEDLPERVDTLVVAGEKCGEYLELAKRRKVAKARKIVFISPPFGPYRIPSSLAASGRFMMVLGEFAARYADVYGQKPFPPWVGLVDGAEWYIPGWVGLVSSL